MNTQHDSTRLDPDEDLEDFEAGAESVDEAGAVTAPDIGSYLEDDATGLWDGDQGSLDAKQRDTLVALLKKAFISSDDRAEWRTLIRDPGPIATNLNNLYFKLVVDERSEVAYAAPVRTADNAFKTLVRDTPNNREETLLLIYLRERFRAETAGGHLHIFADTLAMYEYVGRLRPSSATDKIADERRVANAIAGLVTAGLLVKTRDEGRYRVHRAIEALLPLSRLNQLLDAFRRQGSNELAADRPGADDMTSYSGRHAAPDLPDNALAEAEAAAAESLGGQDDLYEETA